MSRKLFYLMVTAVFLFSGIASAELLSNPSFEEPVVSGATYNIVPTDWQIFQGLLSSSYMVNSNVTDGSQRVVLKYNITMGQTVEAIEANTVYTFTLDAYPYVEGANSQGWMTFRIYDGDSYISLTRSQDFSDMGLTSGAWNTGLTLTWDSTNYPETWGKPLTAAIRICPACWFFIDNSSLTKATTTKLVSTSKSVPEAFMAVSENGAAYDLDVALLQAPTADVDVTLDPNDTQIDLGAGAGAPVTLSFTTSDWSTPQTVSVSAVDDAVVEDVAISAISVAVSSSDAAYDALAVNAVEVKVVDNDCDGANALYNGSFEIPAPPVEGVEIRGVPAGWVELDYRHSYQYDPPASSAIQPTDGDVRYQVYNGADMMQPIGSLIESGARYLVHLDVRDMGTNPARESRLKLACYESGDLLDPNDLQILAISENLRDSISADEWTTVSVAWNSDQDPTKVGQKLAVVLATNDAGFIAIDNAMVEENYIVLEETDGDTLIAEDVITDEVIFSLTRAPIADVVITVDPNDPNSILDLGNGVGEPVTLTFTSENWSTSQTITVTAADDAVDNGIRTGYFLNTVASADPKYNGVYISDVTVTVYDDDGGCGSWGILSGDVNGDCYVNLDDLLDIVADWLDCTDPTDPSCHYAL